MERRFSRAKMPNDPQRTGVSGAAQTTPNLTRRLPNTRRPSSVRSSRSEVETRGQLADNVSNLSVMRKPVEELVNSEDHARLLTRRKKYSQSKVPTPALDEVDLSISIPKAPVQEGRPAGGFVPLTHQPVKHEGNSSSPPLHPTSPKGGNRSPVIARADLSVSTQRALSASPSKLTVTPAGAGSRSRTRLVNSVGSVDSVGSARSTNYHIPNKPGLGTFTYSPLARSPLCTSSDSTALATRPGNTHSVSPVALSPSSAHSTAVSPISLVQQRSTESHESSVSMPSATSSGSGGLLLMLSRRKSGRLGSREMTRSAENPPVTESTEYEPSRHETHSLQRRSSYEMATGKMEQPQRKQKRSSWKQAYKVLKEKRNALFGKGYKSSDEASELSDPVYHLLKCAAIRDHQPSTCKCVCHMQDFDNSVDILEMSSPINVLFSTSNKTRPPGQPHPPSKHRIAQSKLPTSLPSLHRDEENSPPPDPKWYSQEHNANKKSHFSLPNILHRKHRLSGRNSQSTTRVAEPHAREMDSPHYVTSSDRPQSRNPVFTFD